MKMLIKNTILPEPSAGFITVFRKNEFGMVNTMTIQRNIIPKCLLREGWKFKSN